MSEGPMPQRVPQRPDAPPIPATPRGTPGAPASLPPHGGRGAGRELTLGEVIARWVTRASVLACAVSLLVHAVLLGLFAVITIRAAQAGGAGGGSSEVELAIASETELAAIQEASLEVPSPMVVGGAQAELPSVDVLAGPVGEASPTASGEGIGKVAEGMSGAGGDIGNGSGLGVSGAGGGAASFFGVEASGTRFAYIVDTSGSMEGMKLRMLKTALTESIGAMLEHMSFYVVFFESVAKPIGGRGPKWLPATDSGKKWAADEVSKANAFGGTNPQPAFEMAFEMSPRPDAIYFMTDGLFGSDAADAIERLNKQGKRVPVHCILFDVQEPGAIDLMKRIAKNSGGTYTEVRLPP
jgi:hypothetical protein